MSPARGLRGDERGIILPMTMIVLVVLGILVSGLLALGTTEPQIAANLVRGAQALSLAEAGVERAIAAFNEAGSPLMECVLSAMNTEDYPVPPAGCSTDPVTLYQHTTVGAENTGSYTVTFRPTSYATLMLESTGCQASATCPNAASVQRVVRVVISRQYATRFAILASRATVTGNAEIRGNVGAVHGNATVDLSGSEFTQQTATTAGGAGTCSGCDNPARVGDVANSGPNRPAEPIPGDVPGDYLGRATVVFGDGTTPLSSTGCAASSPLTYTVPGSGNNPPQTLTTTVVPSQYILNVTAIGATPACTLTRQNTGPFLGWSMSATAGDWSLSGGGNITPPDGAYYARVKITVPNNTNPGTAASPWRVTLIAGTTANTGQIEVAGQGHMQAFLNGLLMIAGDIRMAGTPVMSGTVFATSTGSAPPGNNGNIHIAGNVTLTGNVIARNTAYVTGSAGGGGQGKIIYNVPTRTRLLSPNLRIVSWNAISTLD